MFSNISRKSSVALVGAFAAALALQVSPASAYTRSATGKPGFVGTPVTQGWSQGDGGVVVSFPGRWVYRSNAYAGAQTFKLTERVYKWNRLYRKWELRRSGTSTSTILPNHAVWVHRYSPVITTLLEDFFSVDVTVEWRRASDGVRIGKAYFDYNAVGDYSCLTSWACSPMASNDAGTGGLFFG